MEQAQPGHVEGALLAASLGLVLVGAVAGGCLTPRHPRAAFRVAVGGAVALAAVAVLLAPRFPDGGAGPSAGALTFATALAAPLAWLAGLMAVRLIRRSDLLGP